jgi:hypothetical protein
MSASAVIVLPDVPPSLPKRRPAPASIADHARFPLAQHPFILTVLLVCLHRGRVETIEHDGVPAIVLTRAHGLRSIVTADGDLLSVEIPASEMREAEYRQHKFFRERLQRKRRAKSIRRCNSGESLQEGGSIAAAVRVSLSSRFPSINEWAALYQLGYDASAIITTLFPVPTASDRRKRGVVESDKKQEEGENDYSDGQQNGYGGGFNPEGAKPTSGFAQPATVMLSTFRMQRQGRRTIKPSRVGRRPPTRKQVNAGLAVMWAVTRDKNMRAALQDILIKHIAPRVVAEARGLDVKRLQDYAVRLRKHVRGIAKDPTLC